MEKEKKDVRERVNKSEQLVISSVMLNPEAYIFAQSIFTSLLQ